MKQFSSSLLAPNSLLLTILFLSFMLFGTSSVVFAQWEPDRRLTFSDSASWTSYNNGWCVAADSDFVHVVWYDKRNGSWQIYYKRSTDSGTNWSPDVPLTSSLSLPYEPSVAASGANVHVAWEDFQNGFKIFYRHSTNGGFSWLPETTLTNGQSFSIDPSIAASGSNIHLVWHDNREQQGWDQFEIYYKGSTDGGYTWTQDTRLTYDTSDSRFGSVAASGPIVHVAWNDERDGNREIYYKRSTDSGGTWSPDVRLTRDSSYSYMPSLSSSGSDVHLVWQDNRDGNFEIYYKRSTDSGIGWSSDVRLTADSSYSVLPSVSASGSNVHVVWYDGRDGIPQIYYKRSFDGGLTWSADKRMTFTSDSSRNPSICAFGPMLHVVWMDQRDGNDEIYYKRNPTGNGVEENVPTLGIDRLPFSVSPNPFTSFTTIPGHSSDSFALYDISGRKVGTYQGDRIGEGLSAGVYFIKSEGKDTKPLRIIKLR